MEKTGNAKHSLFQRISVVGDTLSGEGLKRRLLDNEFRRLDTLRSPIVRRLDTSFARHRNPLIAMPLSNPSAHICKASESAFSIWSDIYRKVSITTEHSRDWSVLQSCGWGVSHTLQQNKVQSIAVRAVFSSYASARTITTRPRTRRDVNM